MKHPLKLTSILLVMFLVTQLIGLFVVNFYLSPETTLPFGLEPPEIEEQSQYYGLFTGIIIAFIIAISLLFFMTKLKIHFVLKLWFFFVVVLALALSLFTLTNSFDTLTAGIPIIATLIALPLAIVKIFGRNFLVHNATELLIYPGIASVFVPLLNVPTVVGLLVIIALYDMWAVWHTGMMQKMAKYQMNNLKIFTGFFVPYLDRKTRQKIKAWKKNLPKSKLKKKKVSVNVAILGGGDIVFPIIAAGVMLKTLGLASALLVILGAFTALAYLFSITKKKKFYPAMVFITPGILLGIAVSYLIL